MEIAIIALLLITLTLMIVQFFNKKTTNNSDSDLLKLEIESLKKNEETFRAQIADLTSKNGQLTGRIEESLKVFNKKEEELKTVRDQNNTLNSELSTAKETIKNLLEKLENQKTELTEMQQKFQKDFENIANKILKENTEDFSKSHREKLNEILNPFKEKISLFENQVKDSYEKSLKETSSLKGEILRLAEMNQKISIEAENLSKALRGDNKKQGNWGEFILEKVLEMSGLRKDHEYITQYSDQNHEGQRIQPDIVVMLPEDKHIIIDSKVSLIDYERYTSSEIDDEKALFLKAHVNSIKTHIKNLSEKNYSTAQKINSPDFVLLFIPIESSFSLALQADPEIFNYSLEKKIVLVSPTTLLATLRTIASVWKQERQNRNALEIAKQSGALYDKFVGFVEDLGKIDKNLHAAISSYDEAFKKLKTGKGNLIGRVENIKKLGAKSTKSLSNELFDDDNEDVLLEKTNP